MTTRKYPSWFNVSTYSELARTVVISSLRDEVQGRRRILMGFAKRYGDCIENLDLEYIDSEFQAYVRFRESFSLENLTDKTGCSLAYEITTTSSLNAILDDESMKARPAVYQGVLWCGELPRRKVIT